MELYDVAFTAYHVRDGHALLALSNVAGVTNTTKIRQLRTRVAATEAALHRELFDNSTGLYANRLYNGSFYRRWAPTVFSPMLLKSTNSYPHRLDNMMKLMEDPATFCVATELSNQPNFLWRMTAAKAGYLRPGQSITCASDECMRDTVLGVSDFITLEALVSPVQTEEASVPLYRFENQGCTGDLCLAVRAPGTNYTRTNASAPPEGWCAPRFSRIYQQPLILWCATQPKIDQGT